MAQITDQADDKGMISTSMKALEETLQMLQGTAQEVGLRIN